MATPQSTGRPVQIVRIEGGKGCRLDEDALKRILLDDRVKDLPVVVVSVAGIFRKGKSFLLNFFLQYMQSRGQGDWLSDNVSSEGFRWRCGSETETLGIWIWDEVFVVPATGGKKVAVVFLDTQGTFDTKSTVNNSATIFALSIMASSVQIYNLSQNIGEDDLQHLQLFTQFGKRALQDTEKKPFQKLLFLVRDWQCGFEKPYGFDGGYELLEQRLEVTDKLDPELQALRQDIKSCFSEMSCFLMPHPGKKVASRQHFDGRLSDIDEEFKDQLRVLVPFVLEPNNLIVKKISSSDTTCRQMLEHFGKLTEIFNRDDLPDAKSIFEASVEANNLRAVNKAMDHYRNDMESAFHGHQTFPEDSTILQHSTKMRKSALELFRREATLGGLECSKPYEEKLEQMIDRELESIRKRNEAERINAGAEKIINDAHEKAKKMMEDAEALCKKPGLVKKIIDVIVNLILLLFSKVFGWAFKVNNVERVLVPMVNQATALVGKEELFKGIAREMIKKRPQSARQDIQVLLDELEDGLRDARRATEMAPAGASDGSAHFSDGGIGVSEATTTRGILLQICAALDEEEEAAHADKDEVHTDKEGDHTDEDEEEALLPSSSFINKQRLPAV